MKKFRLALAASMIMMLVCAHPVYAGEVEDQFIETYRAELDELVQLANEKSYTLMTDEMGTPGYQDMKEHLPYEGFCYPAADGEGLKLRSDYLYYGTLVGSFAEGNGKMYRVNPSSAIMNAGCYIGEWKNDMPNGSGEEYSIADHGGGNITKFHKVGQYVDWYQDGDMMVEYYSDAQRRTYKYKVKDKVPVVIGTKHSSKRGDIPVVAWAEEYSKSFLTFYNTAQTVLYWNIDDGNRKNSYGYWNTGC